MNSRAVVSSACLGICAALVFGCEPGDLSNEYVPYVPIKANLDTPGDPYLEAPELLTPDEVVRLRIILERYNEPYIIQDGTLYISRELQSDLERLREQIEMKKNADWARVLWKMAEQEMAKPRACPSCGSPIEPTIQHAHQTIACPHCGSANEPSMGQATGLYYQGLGVHALAREAAWDLWVAQHKAEQAYNFWRHPSDDDRKTYLNAVAAYETAYFEKTTALHPGFDKTVEQAVAERLAHHETYDNSEEKTERAAYGQFLRLASAGDRAGIESQLDSNDDLEASDVVEAVHEHGDRKATQLMLEIQYKRDDEDDDQAEWIAERFKELDEDLSTR